MRKADMKAIAAVIAAHLERITYDDPLVIEKRGVILRLVNDTWFDAIRPSKSLRAIYPEWEDWRKACGFRD